MIQIVLCIVATENMRIKPFPIEIYSIEVLVYRVSFRSDYPM